ncbi:hypothetical protein FF2_046115 [Malus domestica]
MTMSWSTRNVILSLKSEQCEELKHIQLQAENELREKITSIRSKHEAELTGGESEGITANAVESFGNKPQEDQEVNSKKFMVMVEDAQDSKSPLKEAHDIQSQIKSAMCSRVPYFKELSE